MVKELQVSGAFHSPLMQSAQTGLQQALNAVEIYDTKIPVYANVTARPATKASEIRDLLFRQLTSPVRWEETVRNMIADGASEFVEVGPGKVLQGLIKRMDASVTTTGVEKLSDVEA
jgi:[acyl-carrier-protein] S-malonyltransferase